MLVSIDPQSGIPLKLLMLGSTDFNCLFDLCWNSSKTISLGIISGGSVGTEHNTHEFFSNILFDGAY